MKHCKCAKYTILVSSSESVSSSSPVLNPVEVAALIDDCVTITVAFDGAFSGLPTTRFVVVTPAVVDDDVDDIRDDEANDGEPNDDVDSDRTPADNLGATFVVAAAAAGVPLPLLDDDDGDGDVSGDATADDVVDDDSHPVS
jgi:hypothetical protein